MGDLTDQIIHLEHCRRCEYTAAGHGPFEVELLMQVEAAFEDSRPMVPMFLGVAS